ncbi:MAG: hypothetical protein CM15mP103_02640 [Gammaproteobacteria bacterium]|nr:MAG: hypothetical protein CM15mP103_02640 [Gammaproteobacteria bacterium]
MWAPKPGQMVIVYFWPALMPKRSGVVKKMIAYNGGHLPSARQRPCGPGGSSVDVHSSAESMEKAVAWQGADATWQAQFAEMEAACGSVDDLSTNVLTMK